MRVSMEKKQLEKMGSGKHRSQFTTLPCFPGLSHFTSCEFPKLSPAELSKCLPFMGKKPVNPRWVLSLAALCPLLRCFELLDDLCLQLDTKKKLCFCPNLLCHQSELLSPLVLNSSFPSDPYCTYKHRFPGSLSLSSFRSLVFSRKTPN